MPDSNHLAFFGQPAKCEVAHTSFGLAPPKSDMAERPEGADYQWRKIPLGELSIDPVADERLVRATARAGASWQRVPWAAERSGGPERGGSLSRTRRGEA